MPKICFVILVATMMVTDEEDRNKDENNDNDINNATMIEAMWATVKVVVH